MKKRTILSVIVLGLLTSLFVGIHSVEAANGPPYVHFEVTAGPPLTGSPPYTVTASLGQNIEFAAIPFFGSPPYTYQWSKIAWKSNPMEMMFTSPVDVPGATSQKLEYSETAPGSYEICVEINDSTGNTIAASGPIVIVQPPNNTLPIPTPSPTPTLSPTPQRTSNPTSFAEPTVSFTRWYTTSPNLQPGDRLAHIPPIIEMVSPQNQQLFQTSNVTLKVNVASPFWIIDSVYYKADWLEGIHKIFGVQPNYVDALNASITVNFTEIPDGNHTVTVYANTHDDSHSNATVLFLTESCPPKVSILSIENKPYSSKDLALNFTVDKSLDWTGYSIDGKQNVTIAGNTTITGLSNGLHSITVYSNDTFGHMGASQTITFTRAKPKPFSNLTVMAVSISVATVVVAGLLVYFKKRNR